jgi:hypothetical protein
MATVELARVTPGRILPQELLEKALGGLRHKMQGCSRNNPAEAERYREQQLLLERELSRVRLLLAHNSKVGPRPRIEAKQPIAVSRNESSSRSLTFIIAIFNARSPRIAAVRFAPKVRLAQHRVFNNLLVYNLGISATYGSISFYLLHSDLPTYL